jgi:hypothetical protein
MNYHIELTRNNVTIAQFLAAVRYACKAKGVEIGFSRDEFENPARIYNDHYWVKDGIKYVFDNGRSSEWPADDAPCEAETCKCLPLEYQVYIRNFDGSSWNEICEFTFWDDKVGTGYYYQANKDN